MPQPANPMTDPPTNPVPVQGTPPRTDAPGPIVATIPGCGNDETVVFYAGGYSTSVTSELPDLGMGRIEACQPPVERGVGEPVLGPTSWDLLQERVEKLSRQVAATEAENLACGDTIARLHQKIAALEVALRSAKVFAASAWATHEKQFADQERLLAARQAVIDKLLAGVGRSTSTPVNC